jgi:hypothetical protein
MIKKPNNSLAGGGRGKRVAPLSEEALIKQLEAAIHSNEIWQKALDLIHKRLASGEVSEHMLLRIIVCLSKSAACL